MFCDVITAKLAHNNYFVRAYNLAGCGQNGCAKITLLYQDYIKRSVWQQIQ